MPAADCALTDLLWLTRCTGVDDQPAPSESVRRDSTSSGGAQIRRFVRASGPGRSTPLMVGVRRSSRTPALFTRKSRRTCWPQSPLLRKSAIMTSTGLCLRFYGDTDIQTAVHQVPRASARYCVNFRVTWLSTAAARAGSVSKSAMRVRRTELASLSASRANCLRNLCCSRERSSVIRTRGPDVRSAEDLSSV